MPSRVTEALGYDPGPPWPDDQWADVALQFDLENLASSEFNCQAFPLSRFPTTIAAREQQISDWLAGQIDAKRPCAPACSRYEALGDDSTVELDLIEEQLDEIVETGRFVRRRLSPIHGSPQPARKRWDKELTYGDTHPLRSALSTNTARPQGLDQSRPPRAPTAPGAPGAQPARNPQLRNHLK